MKIGAEAILAGMSYYFQQSTVMKACIVSLESVAHYFPKRYGRLPGEEFVLNP
jgi:hypothetical protein